ncbi:TolC family protein|uniref:Outer membrane protein TolC n=1 Tax=Dendrosporobacter quercicolus TaxID=146817 RepID=A0A1G9W5J9_9FIRM|nr:TolC family protein [Dendrosporobacter quercicolus]NSL47713.1 TolC family protein [Dendrosporobacter quercicolus DSM 1736]SDM79788.1 Outer membrane protein TolC [Dendrosporobacter quercicolus]
MHLTLSGLKRGSAGICLFSLLSWGNMVGAAPVTLEQAVHIALENHLDIKIAANEEQQAEYALQSAKGSQGITLDAANTFYLKKVSHSATASGSDIVLSLPLYSGGKNEGTVKNAETAVDIAILNTKQTEQTVKLQTISAYLTVIEAHQTQAVAQETVDNYQLHLKNVKEQYSAGNIAKSDVLRSEVELADAGQTLLKATNASEVAVNNLRNLLRWKSAEPLELIEEFQCVPVAYGMAECVALAKAHRPDLAQYRLAVKSAEQSAAIAGADQKPVVSLVAATGWDSSILPEGGDLDTYIGVTTSWNLFDSGITRSNVKKARLAVVNARLELESQEDTVELAVKEYYLGLKEAEKRRETTQAAIHKAQEDYFIAAAQYRVGEGIILDVIDAQLALTTAQNNDIEAQYDYAIYRAKLENAMGMN